MEDNKNIKCYCNNCGRVTNHRLLFRTQVDDVEDQGEGFYLQWRNEYDVLQCLGCDNVKLKDTIEDPIGEKSVSYYPPPISRRSPAWKWKLPDNIRGLLDEIYAALQANSMRLAMMGARAVIDLLVLEEIGDVGTFKDKLDALKAKGFIGERQLDTLNAALEMGHAATHRGVIPNKEDLEAVMDIVENVLQLIYPLSQAATEIFKKTPVRPKTKS